MSVRAHCVSDILGTSTGFNTDIGKRYGFSGEWEVSKNQPNAVSGSMTFGISFAGGAGVTGCKTTLISCSK